MYWLEIILILIILGLIFVFFIILINLVVFKLLVFGVNWLCIDLFCKIELVYGWVYVLLIWIEIICFVCFLVNKLYGWLVCI